MVIKKILCPDSRHSQLIQHTQISIKYLNVGIKRFFQLFAEEKNTFLHIDNEITSLGFLEINAYNYTAMRRCSINCCIRGRKTMIAAQLRG